MYKNTEELLCHMLYSINGPFYKWKPQDENDTDPDYLHVSFLTSPQACASCPRSSHGACLLLFRNEKMVLQPLKNWICNLKALEKEISMLGWFHCRILQTLKGELKPISYNLLQKTEQKGTFPKLFYEANITLIPKPAKDKRKP